MYGYFSIFFVILDKLSRIFLFFIPFKIISCIIGFSLTVISIMPELLDNLTFSK